MFDVKLYQIFNKYKSTVYNKKKNYKKKSYISIIIRPIIFFKNIIGLIQIFGGVNSYFYRLNFGNIKIIIHIYIISKFWESMTPHSST